MLYQYPLETLARRRATKHQADFAREARRVLVDTDDALFEAHDHGLTIFASNEDALAGSVRELREMYGDFLEFRRPRVRMIPGDPPQEPIMHARVTTRTEFSPAIRSELKARGAKFLEQCVQGRVEVIRAEGALQALLGLPARLDTITDGTAAHSIRLVRYAPAWKPTRPAA